MKHEIIKNEPVRGDGISARGRGRVQFPEFLELNVSKDGTRADCLVYPDTPNNRKKIRQAKCNYNRYETGEFKGRRWIHRFETRHGEPMIIIQRIV